MFAFLLTAVAFRWAAQTAPAPSPRFSPSIRIYNGIRPGSDSALDLVLDGDPVAHGVRRGSISGPYKPNSEWHGTLVVRKAGQGEDLLDLRLDTAGMDNIVVLLGDPAETLDSVNLTVKSIPEADEQPRLYILNAVSRPESFDSVDVYVLKPGDELADARPTVSKVAYKATQIIPVVPGTYRIVVTKDGAKDVLAQTADFEAKVLQRVAAIVVPGASNDAVRIERIDL